MHEMFNVSAMYMAIQVGSLLADGITYVLKIKCECRQRNEIPRDGCVLLSRTRHRHQGRWQILRVEKLLAPPVRKYSVRIGGSFLSSLWRLAAAHVRDYQRASDPGRSVSLCCVGTTNVVFKVVFHHCEVPYASRRTTGFVMDLCDFASHTTYVLLRFVCRPDAEVPRDGCCCLLGRELFTKENRKYIEWVLLFAHVVCRHHVPRNRREHEQGVHHVGTANDVFFFVGGSTSAMVIGEDRRICPAASQYLPPEHVRDVRRSRHVRGDPVRLSLCFERRDGLREGLWRSCREATHRLLTSFVIRGFSRSI